MKFGIGKVVPVVQVITWDQVLYIQLHQAGLTISVHTTLQEVAVGQIVAEMHMEQLIPHLLLLIQLSMQVVLDVVMGALLSIQVEAARHINIQKMEVVFNHLMSFQVYLLELTPFRLRMQILAQAQRNLLLFCNPL